MKTGVRASLNVTTTLVKIVALAGVTYMHTMKRKCQRIRNEYTTWITVSPFVQSATARDTRN